ncbi:MAG: hypothetical protein GC145_14450 [Caulobacter sp.]|nr:hypothetical protein [Caulobacter sp.]
MPGYAEALAAERRLCILQLLVEGRGRSNERVVQIGLKARGHWAGIDDAYVREHLRWLVKAECVTTSLSDDHTMLVSLTDHGAAVAEGRIACQGVAQPPFGA